MCDCRRGFGLEIRSVHFNTRLVTTLNYSTIAFLHILQISTAHGKSLQSVVSCRSLVKASDNGDSSVSALTSLPSGSQLHRLSLLSTDSLTTHTTDLQRERELLYDWRFTVKPLEYHDQYSFFQLNTCGHSPYVTFSLTRGWVCRLQ
jgi:hypothetical protein